MKILYIGDLSEQALASAPGGRHPAGIVNKRGFR